MQIQSRNSYTPQFGALHIGNCGELSLYKITDSADLNFLKLLPQQVKMKERMPNLSRQEAERWDEMITYAVNNAHTKTNTTYIETKDNKVCGIITFDKDKTFTLDCICTWPIEIGKKVKLAGQTLFYQLFKDFEEFGGRKITLEAITDGPINTIDKYENLGFRINPNKIFPTKTVMETNQWRVEEQTKRLSYILDYEPVEEEKVNLLKDIEI